METSYLYIIIATVAYGFAEAISNHRLKKYAELTSVGFILIGQFFSLIFATGWNLIFNVSYAGLNLYMILGISGLGLLYYMANKLYYGSYKTEDASSMSVVIMISIVISTVLGRIMFNEVITPIQWLGIVILIIAVFRYISGPISKDNLQRIFSLSHGKKLALAGATLYGIGFSFSKFFSLELDPHLYQQMKALLGLPLIFVFDFSNASKQLKVIRNWKIILALIPAVTMTFTYDKLKYMAFSLDIPLPIADSIDNTVVFVILAVEYFIFQIKQEDIFQKLLMAGLALVGIMLVIS